MAINLDVINKGAISLNDNFYLLAEKPLDSRGVVKTLAGIQTLIDNGAAYAGMITYVTSEKRLYEVYDDNGTLKYKTHAYNDDELRALIGQVTTAAMEFKGATATLPTGDGLNNGDLYKMSAAIVVSAENDAEGIGFTTKIGDSIVYDNGKWYLIPTGDDIEDTWRPVDGVNNDAGLKFVEGSVIDIDVAATGEITIGHSEIDVENLGTEQTRTYISSLEFDDHGHVVSYKTGTETVENTNTTYDFESQVEESEVYFTVKASDADQAETIYVDAYSKNEITELLSPISKDAGDAKSLAEGAVSTANDASSVANEAKELAEEAKTAAITAQNSASASAEAAAASAGTAEQMAQSAFSSSENASASAEAAASSAGRAENFAESASSYAGNANTSAEAAERSANSAAGSRDAAIQARTDAEAARDAASGSADSAAASANAALTNAGIATQKAEDANTAKEAAVAAQSKAEAAQAAASSAANSSLAASLNAGNSAEAAAGSASAAAGSVEDAADSAAEAAASAKTAGEQATAASNSASEASGHAEDAKEFSQAAVVAQGNAEAAQTKAEAAQAKAEAAQAAAEASNTSATAIANEAKGLASTASANAQTALDTINAFLTEETLDDTVNTLKEIQKELKELGEAVELEEQFAGKADKVTGATEGNLAGLDKDGNLTDSGASVDSLKKYTDDAIKALDVSDITGFGAGKTLATLTETDGKIAATFQDISITESQISDFGDYAPANVALGEVQFGHPTLSGETDENIDFLQYTENDTKGTFKMGSTIQTSRVVRTGDGLKATKETENSIAYTTISFDDAVTFIFNCGGAND